MPKAEFIDQSLIAGINPNKSLCIICDSPRATHRNSPFGLDCERHCRACGKQGTHVGKPCPMAYCSRKWYLNRAIKPEIWPDQIRPSVSEQAILFREYQMREFERFPPQQDEVMRPPPYARSVAPYKPKSIGGYQAPNANTNAYASHTKRSFSAANLDTGLRAPTKPRLNTDQNEDHGSSDANRGSDRLYDYLRNENTTLKGEVEHYRRRAEMAERELLALRLLHARDSEQFSTPSMSNPGTALTVTRNSPLAASSLRPGFYAMPTGASMPPAPATLVPTYLGYQEPNQTPGGLPRMDEIVARRNRGWEVERQEIEELREAHERYDQGRVGSPQLPESSPFVKREQ